MTRQRREGEEGGEREKSMNNNQCIIDALLIISRLIRSLEVNKRQWQERDRQTHAHIEGGGGGGRRRRGKR